MMHLGPETLHLITTIALCVGIIFNSIYTAIVRSRLDRLASRVMADRNHKHGIPGGGMTEGPIVYDWQYDASVLAGPVSGTLS